MSDVEYRYWSASQLDLRVQPHPRDKQFFPGKQIWARHVGSSITPQLLVAMVTRVLNLYVQHCKVLLVHASDTGYAKFRHT